MISMKMAHPENIAKRLIVLREIAGLKQVELCEKLDISKGTYNHYESGVSRPIVDTAIKLSVFYGVTLDFIYTGDMNNMRYELAKQIEASGFKDVLPSAS